MKHITGRELAKIVQARGWKLARVHGSHHIFKLAGKRENLVIPIHGNETLKTGILRSLMRIADLSDEDLSK